jgi:hypothetical protein
MPEVQREQVDPVAASAEKAPAPSEGLTSPTPPAKPTPVEFFPKKRR